MKLILRERCKKLFIGEATFKKRDLWMMGTICVLLGIVLGFINAPLTHGITISCGNNNDNRYGGDYIGAEQKEEEGEGEE